MGLTKSTDAANTTTESARVFHTLIIAGSINKCRRLFHSCVFLRHFAGDRAVYFGHSFHAFQSTTLSWTYIQHAPGLQQKRHCL